MIQFENFSDKAKQVIELFKNCKYKDSPKVKDKHEYSYNHFNSQLILHSCALFNVQDDQIDILEYCKSKNYWLENSK